ncbi:MAG: hypothetical protein GX567_08550 [Clostridia bacterium]|nr:hypothetical protein [Clostridia bacterium]
MSINDIIAVYQTDLGCNHLILSTNQINYDQFQIHMLEENHIKCMMDCKAVDINGEEKFVYEISGLHPIGNIYEKTKIDHAALCNIISEIIEAIQMVSEYLLDSDHLIIHQDYVYMNKETKQIYLCYLPTYECDKERVYHELAEFFIEHVEYEDEEAVTLAYDFYKLSQEDNFNICRLFDVTRKKPQKEIELPKKDTLQDSIAVVSDTNLGFFYICGIVLFIIILLTLLFVMAFKPDKQSFAVLMGIVGGTVSFIGLLVIEKIQQTGRAKMIAYVDQTTKDIFDQDTET